MQAFLAALGTSQIIIGMFLFFGITLNSAGLATAKNVAGVADIVKEVRGCNVEAGAKRGYVVTAIGASILGIGMALAGACPGTLYSQLGSGYVPFLTAHRR